MRPQKQKKKKKRKKRRRKKKEEEIECGWVRDKNTQLDNILNADTPILVIVTEKTYENIQLINGR